MSIFKLRQTKQQLSQAIEKKEPLVVKATTVQSVDLELLDTSFKLAIELEKNKTSSVKKQHLKNLQEKLFKLYEVDDILEKQCDSLIDECHLTLDSKQEVNFPLGKKDPIKPEINTLIYQIHKILSDPTIKVKTSQGEPSISELIRLEKNEQHRTDFDLYIKSIVPVIAKQLLERCTSFENVTNEDCFIRYVSGQIPSFIESVASRSNFIVNKENMTKNYPEWNDLYKENFHALEIDLMLIRQLSLWYESECEEDKNLTNMIAVASYLLLVVLPNTFKKSGNQAYGPSPLQDKLPGKMIPYIAAGTPSSREFGRSLTEACCSYQYVFAFPLAEQQVASVLRSLEVSARYYMSQNQETLHQTSEYEYCLKLFGVSLSDIDDPEVLKKACENISKEIQLKLDLTYDVVGRNVTSHTEKLSNTGTDLVRQFRSVRTMSGTPFNVDGYAKKLRERYLHDKGIEGKILDVMLERSDTTRHDITFETVGDFLDETLKKSSNQTLIRGIIDAGGFFKKFNHNGEVAKALMQNLSKKQDQVLVDKRIEAVLFFDKDPGGLDSNILYAWKKGASHPERIGGTSEEQLGSKGLDPSKCFVYYDQNHTTGTDIKQDPKAVNLLTFDERMTTQDLTQAVMRLRQYLSTQNVEIVTSKEEKKDSKTIAEILRIAAKNQSNLMEAQIVNYYKQHINSIFRSCAKKKIKELVKGFKEKKVGKEEFITKIKKYRAFIVTQTDQDPYLLYGKLKQQCDTKKMLETYLDLKFRAFKKVEDSKEEIEELQKEVNELKEDIKSSQSLPKETEVVMVDDLDAEQEIEEELEIEEEQEVEQEQEIELELQSYLDAPHNSIRPEGYCQERSVNDWINFLLKGGVDQEYKIEPLPRLFDEDFYVDKKEKENKKIPYGEIFKEDIYTTLDFRQTCEQPLPVFHPLQKPARQILAVRIKDKMKWLLLSERQANYSKAFMEHLYEKGLPLKEGEKNDVSFWLIQPDGTLLVNHEKAPKFPLKDESVQKGLLEINAFQGNIDYLDDHDSEAESWLYASNKEIKIRYLDLKSRLDEKQKEIFPYSHVIQESSKKVDAPPHLCPPRLERERFNVGSYEPTTPLEAKLCKLDKVHKLNGKYVHLLGVDENSEDGLDKQACKSLNEKNIDEFNRGQFQKLKPAQIPFLQKHQMKWLPLNRIQFLKTIGQIYDVNGQGNERYALSKEQALALVVRQKNLVQGVNPEFYQFFTHAWQIGAVPLEHINKIDPKYLNLLTREQFKRLPHELSSKLGDLHDLDKISWIHGDLIDQIPPKYHDRVVESQIREIDDVEVIKNLHHIAEKPESTIGKGAWVKWVDPKMVQYLDHSQMQYLVSADQVAEVPDEAVKFLLPQQIQWITSTQAPFLEGEAQIQACPKELLLNLKNDQLKLLSTEQLKMLTPKQIEALIDRHVLLDRLPKALSDEQVKQFMSKKLFEIVKLEQLIVNLNLFNHDQLLLISQLYDKQQPIWTNLSREKIQLLDTKELIDLLSASQIKDYLSEPQVKLLHAEDQIQACSDALVKYLCKYDELNQIAMISDQQVPFLVKEQLGDIADNHVKLLGKDMTQLLPNDKVPHICEKQAPWLIAEQVSCCPLPFIGALAEGHISLLTNDQLNRLDQGKVVSKLADKQIKELRQPQAIRAVSLRKVVLLSREQLRKRHWTQACVYTIGILILGIVSSIVALVAYLSLLPFIVAYCNPKAGKSFKGALNAIPHRLGDYSLKMLGMRN